MKAVDLFAGAGGFTEGASIAGLDVVWAANHNPAAVACHADNHPETAHECQDLRQADFGKLPPFEVLLASPACQGHSQASQPRRRAKHDADRSTAWAVVDCAETCLPAAIVVENVPDLLRWRLYPVWRSALEALGYHLTEQVLDAALEGVPQHRRRLFVTGRRDRAPRPVEQGRVELVPGADILDDSAGGWAAVDSKPAGVRKRAARAYERGLRRCFLQHTSDHRGRELHRPLGTITCASSHWHLLDGGMIRPLTVRELARAQGFRDSFRLPTQVGLGTRLVGNAVPPPLAARVIREVMG